MRKVIITLVVLLVITSSTNDVGASDPLIYKKNYVGCWEKDDAGEGNYTSLLVNNSFDKLGFNYDYLIIEKEEFLSVDRVTTGEVVYTSVVWITNSSSSWFVGASIFRAKIDGNDLNTAFNTLVVDSRYICEGCCLANSNVTIANNYQIGDHVLWVWVKSGVVNVFWHVLSVVEYYQYKVYLPEESRTTIVQQLGDNIYLVVAIVLGFPVALFLDSKTHKLL